MLHIIHIYYIYILFIYIYLCVANYIYLHTHNYIMFISFKFTYLNFTPKTEKKLSIRSPANLVARLLQESL